MNVWGAENLTPNSISETIIMIIIIVMIIIIQIIYFSLKEEKKSPEPDHAGT